MHNTKEIVCEGLTDKCLCVLLFRSKKEKAFHQRTYCEKECGKCEFHLMLQQKYEDE